MQNSLGKVIVIMLLSLVWVAATAVGSQAKMVTVAKNWINLRSGPGIKYKVLWQLDKGYPLKVIETRGKWYKVRDYENDVGWVHSSLTSPKPHVIVKKSRVNVRSGPGTDKEKIAMAEKGTVFSTLKRTKNWVKVRHEQGVTGWISRRLVWGW